MILLDGKTLATQITSELKQKIIQSGLKINLDIVLVGDDPSSLKYIDLKQKKAAEVGIGGQLYHLPVVAVSDLPKLVTALNEKRETSSFFIQLPIPGLDDPSLILRQILPQKDADGLNPNSGVYPAVVKGIVRLLENYQINFDQKNIVIINDSDLIGQPLKKYFSQYTSNITLLNRQSLDLTPHTLQADILISATGVKNLLTADMVKSGVVAIDVGGGDIDFENVSIKSSYITPTFGGVGPMTVASLLENTYLLTTR
ncbi:TPA: bifunctional methylenetetrahydrofolate dehydrogenase/methenyltetrahydrofolate cyclohydrolase [Candidatus Shapirobacteria bacterium]|nr:bifunctional methylenetetrahydrofolate dehydrogenase/methenyltetrahydrofolate cyclohydrolase [Candidatus Shapirobacteria bacterium]